MKKKVTLESVARLITGSQENLARMVANGFSAQEKTFAEKIDSAEARLNTKIDDVETRLSQQITGINNRIGNLALNRATRDKLLVLDKRVLRVEQKLGIDFKKPQHV